MFPKTGRGCVPTIFMGAARDARAVAGLVLRRELRGWCEGQNVMFSVAWRER